MFSWICKRCGRDNPPSATTCISCGTRFDAEPEPQVETAAPLVDQYAETSAEPYDEHSDPQPTFAPPISRPSRELPSRPVASKEKAAGSRSALPTWLLTLLSCFAILGLGSAIYFGVVYYRNGKQATSTGLDPAANVARTKLASPLSKFVEVVGIRLVQDSRRKPQARFVVINHSLNSLDEMTATVTLWASTTRSEEDSIGNFTFKVPSLPGNGSKEMTAPLSTKLKFYELPDWQNATPEVQITSP